MESPRSAACLCGAVQLHLPDARREVHACHCGMCRRWGGGPLLAVDCGQAVRIEGEAQVQTWQSSAWAERGFCGRCGTHLFYRLLTSGALIVPAGLLGEAGELALTEELFIDHKPSWYGFANRTEQLTEAEVLAKFGM